MNPQDTLKQGNAFPAAGLDFVLRTVLAVILLYACADKIIHPQAFAGIVHDYKLLPEPLVGVVALWLPWLELVLGVCLYTGLMAEGALALTTGLFTCFWLALIVNYFRGVNVNCGCFSSTAEEAAPMLFYIGRDALLLALAVASCAMRLRVVGKGGAFD